MCVSFNYAVPPPNPFWVEKIEVEKANMDWLRLKYIREIEIGMELSESNRVANSIRSLTM